MHFTSSDDQNVLLHLPAEHARAAVEHAQGLEDAASVMLHRTASYGLAWQRYGALSNLVNAARKVERLMGIWWDGNKGDIPALHKDALDDAVDAINYLQFFITCAQQGNVTGDRRELPEKCEYHVLTMNSDDNCVICGVSTLDMDEVEVHSVWTERDD